MVALFSLTLGDTVFGQTTIDCTNPSIPYDMTAANAKSGGSPTNWELLELSLLRGKHMPPMRHLMLMQ